MFGLLTTLTSSNLAALSITHLSMAPRFKIGMKLGLMLCSALLLNACSDSQPGTNPTAGQTSAQPASVERNFPEPPPPITSTTQILSGGWLLSGDGSDPQFDSIVVIRDGLIVGVGKRGTVDVPADSVGVDASGKWILPGTTAQLSAAFGQRDHDAPTQFASTQMPAIEVGRSAELVLLNSNPLTDPQALEDVHAIVSNGQVEVLITDPS